MIVNFEYQELFSIPLLVAEIDLPHEEIADFTREHLGRIGRYTSYYHGDHNDWMCTNMPVASRFSDIAFRLAENFKETCEFNRCTLGRFGWWFSYYKENDRHCPHVHPGAIISGTYYPYADDNSTSIRFRSPHYTQAAMTAAGSANEDTLWHFHQPKTGQILFWPSWLEHEVSGQGAVEVGKERVAISFNFSKMT